jgi:signal recognition particle subunit SRP54
VEQARQKQCQVVILDTAGRLEIDEELVHELERVRDAVRPQEILLVADAALGQEAVSVARHFDEALSVNGIILTKLDGDARGGAALSMRHTTGKPIKFITTGEQPADLETFHPDRMASRILGMGDILTLVERAQTEFNEKEAQELEEKVRNATFGFDDFLVQIGRINRMGGLMSLLKFLPGMNNFPTELLDAKTFKRTEGMIRSMTPTERKLPETINASRRARIAKGCGCQPQEVTEQIKTFMNMREIMARMSRGGAASMMSSLMGGGNSIANLASMMQGHGAMGTGLPGANYASKGISHQEAMAKAREKAKKDAKRKQAKEARKKNRRK